VLPQRSDNGRDIRQCLNRLLIGPHLDNIRFLPRSLAVALHGWLPPLFNGKTFLEGPWFARSRCRLDKGNREKGSRSSYCIDTFSSPDALGCLQAGQAL